MVTPDYRAAKRIEGSKWAVYGAILLALGVPLTLYSLATLNFWPVTIWGAVVVLFTVAARIRAQQYEDAYDEALIQALRETMQREL